MTCEYFSSPMNWGTRTLPNSDTRPRSLRPRSTSMTCSDRSFSLRFSSSASLVSSSSLLPRGRVPAIDAHQHLRRRPDDRDLPHAQKVHIRRRVHVTERPVYRERVRADLGFEPLREYDLVNVARGDVLLRGLHHVEEPLAGNIRGH